jgi:hypothetical protein
MRRSDQRGECKCIEISHYYRYYNDLVSEEATPRRICIRVQIIYSITRTLILHAMPEIPAIYKYVHYDHFATVRSAGKPAKSCWSEMLCPALVKEIRILSRICACHQSSHLAAKY